MFSFSNLIGWPNLYLPSESQHQNFKLADDEDSVIFGENNLYDAIDLILNGKPENINALTHEDIIEYSDEQKAEWDKIYSELPMALDIILYNGHFELGSYKTKFHDRNWKKTKN